MKYVRTNDGIYEIIEETSLKYNWQYYRDKNMIGKNMTIINQSDNLIDLVDGILVEEKGNPNNWFIMETDEFIDTPKDEIMIKNWTYKAFIKTNKGLLYVAELKNGKLELL